LLKAYAKRSGGRIKLVAVDREDDPQVFKALQDHADQRIKLLAEFMTRTIHPGGVGSIRVDVRAFEPPELTAVIRATEASSSQMKAREIINDPNMPQDMREMAQEMLRMARNSSMRLVLNANNPMVRLLAQQDFEHADVINLMGGIYNSAILYNQELMTPQNARIFYEQYQDLMSRTLDYIMERGNLQRREAELKEKHEELRKRTQPKGGAEPKHLIFFLMTPMSEDYKPFIETVREVIENRFGCQLFIASDRQYRDTVGDNVYHHMNQAHAFLAEVTDANPNVMYELGIARHDLRERPMVLLRRNDQQQLPADLHGRIYISYTELSGEALANHLESQLRTDQRIKALIERKGLERYISPKFLMTAARLPTIEPRIWHALADKFPTKEAWKSVIDKQVANLLPRDDADMAEIILKRIKQALAEGE
jgi:molecular chaperone HtpG